MKLIVSIVSLGFLGISASAHAEQRILQQQCKNPTASIIDYGIYEEEIDSQHEEHGVAAGYNNMTYNKRLIQSTTDIPGRENLNFGFRYSLHCEGYNPEEVPVTIRVLHPKMQNPTSKVELTVSEWGDNAWTSYLNYHTGFLFNEPWEIVTGDWTIQVLFKGRKLAEKSFSVSQDTHNPTRDADATK